MLTPQLLAESLTGLTQLIPASRQMSVHAHAMAWDLLPSQAKLDLERRHLLYAARQLSIDPCPDERRPLVTQLLRYLYPLRNGVPCTEAGLRRNLADRMQDPDRFHSLEERQELVSLPRLPEPRTPCDPELADRIRQRLHNLLAASRGNDRRRFDLSGDPQLRD